MPQAAKGIRQRRSQRGWESMSYRGPINIRCQPMQSMLLTLIVPQAGRCSTCWCYPIWANWFQEARSQRRTRSLVRRELGLSAQGTERTLLSSSGQQTAGELSGSSLGTLCPFLWWHTKLLVFQVLLPQWQQRWRTPRQRRG